MKVNWKISKFASIEVEAAGIKEAWEQLGPAIEALKSEPCGNCDREDTRLVFRQKEDFKYYERWCDTCFNRLSYGQAKKGGGIYPRRKYHKDHPLVKAKKVKVGDAIPKGGWEKYEQAEED